MPYTLSRSRFWFIQFLVAVIFALIIYQIVQLTVIRRDTLVEVADRQHSLTVQIAPNRGPVLDRSGKDLSINLRVPSIYAVPRLISKREKPALSRRLATALNLQEDFVASRLWKDKAFVWIKRRVTREEALEIRQWKHQGLGLLEENKRFFPQGELLAHVLGFTNIDNKGLEGIELILNRELSGREGQRLTKRDALGSEIKAFEAKHVPAVNGSRIVLTIDHYIQYLTERALERAYEKWNAEGAMAVVMEPATGRILAMANRPTYNPNNPGNAKREQRRNRVVTDMYEPGSVFKIVTASAVLNEEKVDSDTMIFCENGEYRYGSRTLHDVHAYGDLSFEEVIVKSSNIGTVKLAAMLEQEVFYRYIQLFGFGKPTGIDFPGEASGFIRPPSAWSRTSPYNIPMGHEVMVTPLQVVRAMAVIANGGNLVQPYLVERIEDQSGVVLRESRPEITGNIIRPEVAKVMRGILTRVVDEGTGKRARIEGVAVAGKTGTAQKVLPDGKGYSHEDFVSSFAGFAPAEDPMLVMAVVVDNPKPKYYGGTVAGPVFKEVMEAALIHLGFIPEQETSEGQEAA